jgi:hypothetical protein
MAASFEVNLFDRKLKKAERVVILFRSFQFSIGQIQPQ